MYLGANACIIGRNVEKTESVAKDIATARPGAKVIGIGAVDVRKFESLQGAVDRCVSELGGIDFVMYGDSRSVSFLPESSCANNRPVLVPPATSWLLSTSSR